MSRKSIRVKNSARIYTSIVKYPKKLVEDSVKITLFLINQEQKYEMPTANNLNFHRASGKLSRCKICVEVL